MYLCAIYLLVFFLYEHPFSKVKKIESLRIDPDLVS